MLQLCRQNVQERERIAASYKAAMEAFFDEYTDRYKSLKQERLGAEEGKAEHHAAALQSLQQTRKPEQVPLMLLHTLPHGLTAGFSKDGIGLLAKPTVIGSISPFHNYLST